MLTKIAVVGAPAAGKSEFAIALWDEIVKSEVGCEECMSPVDIIDDYPEYVAYEHDSAEGFDADYVTNVGIAIERRARERDALRREAKTLITVGSIFESATYAAMSFEARSEVVSEAENEDDARRVEAVMRLFACLFVDTFRPDYVFYLPYLGDDDWFKRFDQNLQAAFQAFNLYEVTTITDGVQQAIDIIFSKETHAEGAAQGADTQAEVADERGVREG